MHNSQQNVVTFNYNNISVKFQKGNNLLINATEMAKVFNKRPTDWLKLQSTKEFIQVLSVTKKIVTADLVIVRSGGIPDMQGTWLHEDVAIELARWLNPSFAIWCNDRIKELLRHGLTATPQKIDELIQNPDLVIGLATQLKQERQQTEYLRQQSAKQAQELQKQAPKVEYYNNVLNSESTYNTNLIAKELGMSARTLNKILADNKIQYKQAGVWVLNHKFQDKGFTKTKTTLYKGSDGIERTCMLTVWTEKGREFIHHQISTLKTA
ncbi:MULTISPECIES: phage antirepressor KilAC domain-containing protein [unclassified Apibacter]|uniref:phage antirepressor KilAC domain-containing protein n=1 Tax=unclassified Apibacter TaxID=2630820 RepID=UPI00135E11C4|nr:MULTISPECIES: phage antirepressor KilAC domain-containing protein [unclassified Apibacter]MXP04796.1 phage antirepressor protein [Apibacter sp. B3546]